MSYEGIVRSLIKIGFREHEVDSFEVVPSDDWDEDEYVTVTVVLNDEIAPFDVKRAVEFKRALRAKLDERKGAPFPVVNFVSKSDALA